MDKKLNKKKFDYEEGKVILDNVHEVHTMNMIKMYWTIGP